MSDKQERSPHPASLSKGFLDTCGRRLTGLSFLPCWGAITEKNSTMIDRRFFGPYRKLKGVTPGGESWRKTVCPETDHLGSSVGGMIDRPGGGHYSPPAPWWTLEGVARTNRLCINRQGERGPDKAPSVDFSRKPFPKDFAQADHKAAFALGGRGVWPAIRASVIVTMNLPSTLYALYPPQAQKSTA